ncbi:MAG: radical SAM protein, partial [Planctomycetota bacterium]
MQPFTLLIKPSGSDCNVDCKYCFYKCRAPEIGQGRQRMSDEVLEKLVKDYMQLGFAESGFAWQGGEPTLMGLDFYKKVVGFQKQYGKADQVVSNALQTNAVLLDEKWCTFLHENNFLVGISIDGPKEYHDHYRLDFSG